MQSDNLYSEIFSSGTVELSARKKSVTHPAKAFKSVNYLSSLITAGTVAFKVFDFSDYLTNAFSSGLYWATQQKYKKAISIEEAIKIANMPSETFEKYLLAKRDKRTDFFTNEIKQGYDL